MNIRNLSVGEVFLLASSGQLQRGFQDILKYGRCILCKKSAQQAGVCCVDNSKDAHLSEKPGTKKIRLIFWAACEECAHDPALDQKVLARISAGMNGEKSIPANQANQPTPLSDGQTFDL